MDIASRLAHRFIVANHHEDESDLTELLDAAYHVRDTLDIHLDAYSVLMRADTARAGRAVSVPIVSMEGDESQVRGTAKGSGGEKYQVRVTFLPRRGHRCTCPDWEKNRARSRKIPCKHVLALISKWHDQKAKPAFVRVERVIGLGESARTPRENAVAEERLMEVLSGPVFL